MKKVIPIHVSAAVVLCLALLTALPACVSAGCTDEAFSEAVRIYDTAVKEASAAKQIPLLEQAFRTCPSHGHFAQGYVRLGKLYLQRGDTESALKQLLLANRFRAVLLEQSLTDLADTNRLLAKIYREKGNDERALAHMSLYRAVSKLRGEKPGKDYVTNVEEYYDTVYSPGTVKDLLSVDGSMLPDQRAALTPVEIWFDYDEAGLDEHARTRLSAVANALRDPQFKGVTIIIEGHTDENGSAAYNYKLGKKRAAEVTAYLADKLKGTNIRLIAVSSGKSEPNVSRNDHPKAMWDRIDRLNRRAVIRNAGLVKKGIKNLEKKLSIGKASCPK